MGRKKKPKEMCKFCHLDVYAKGVCSRHYTTPPKHDLFCLSPKIDDYDWDKVLLEKIVNRVLLTMSGREPEILRLRFGIGDVKYPRTLDEVGRVFKVTRERIRYLEARAMRRFGYRYREVMPKE